MTTFACITTFNEDYYNNMAYAMVKTYKKFWPSDINLYVYLEDFTLPEEAKAPNIIEYDIFEKCYPNFQATLDWLGTKRNYIRGFLFKTYAFIHAVRNLKEDVIIYLDADSLTFKTIDKNWLLSLLPDNSLTAYMGVTMNKGSMKENAETCIYMFDKTHKGAKDFIDHYEHIYESRDIMDESRFEKPHDTWAYTECVQKAKAAGHRINDVNHNRKSQSPLRFTEFGKHFRHFKGKRKVDSEFNTYVDMIMNEESMKVIDRLINKNKKDKTLPTGKYKKKRY